MNIKNQNYAHEKVWYMRFFLVTLLFEFIDQKFKLFKGWGGGVLTTFLYICTCLQLYFKWNFFFQSSKGDKGGSGGADGTLEDLAEESFSECLNQTELRSNSAYCLSNDFGEKRIRFFFISLYQFLCWYLELKLCK